MLKNITHPSLKKIQEELAKFWCPWLENFRKEAGILHGYVGMED